MTAGLHFRLDQLPCFFEGALCHTQPITHLFSHLLAFTLTLKDESLGKVGVFLNIFFVRQKKLHSD